MNPAGDGVLTPAVVVQVLSIILYNITGTQKAQTTAPVAAPATVVVAATAAPAPVAVTAPVPPVKMGSKWWLAKGLDMLRFKPVEQIQVRHTAAAGRRWPRSASTTVLRLLLPLLR